MTTNRPTKIHNIKATNPGKCRQDLLLGLPYSIMLTELKAFLLKYIPIPQQRIKNYDQLTSCKHHSWCC